MRAEEKIALSPPDAAKKIRVARVGAAHGVRGEMKLWSFTQDPAAVAEYGPLESEDGSRQFDIESMRAAKDHFVVRVKGVDDREAAAKLCNLDLYVPRDRLPPIEEDDTYYHADLVGLDAVTPEGALLGTVTALHNFGAGDLIEIATAQGGEPLLLPFDDATVPEIDIAARKVVVMLPSVSE
jgi:16S rRNA processing protein RimM